MSAPNPTVDVFQYSRDPDIARIQDSADHAAAGGRFDLSDSLDRLAERLADVGSRDAAEQRDHPAPAWLSGRTDERVDERGGR